MDLSASVRRSGYLSHFSSGATGGTIMCGICRATYAPSHTHEYLLQAPPIALESAFMSMCHFCFRCRRPSCPSCWDNIHGVCGQCAEETRLPFRLKPAPLDDLPFVPARLTVPEHTHTAQSPLICVFPGRFQMPSQPPIDRITARPDRSSAVEAQSAAASSKAPLATSMPIDIDTIKTHPAARSKRPPASSSPDIDEIKTRPERTAHRTKRVGRVLTTIALVLLIIVALLILATLLSSDANAFIAGILHVDIRAEIAYLWHLLQRLF